MKNVAIVVPGYDTSGGVRTVAGFIGGALQRSGYSIHIYSLATSFRDENSRRILRPDTWFRDPVQKTDRSGRFPVTEVGCNFPEVEVFRYLPRGSLANVLDTYDLIQIVAGTPAWAYVCRHCSKPVALQVATLTSVERAEKLKGYAHPVGWWKRYMTKKVSEIDRCGFEVVDAIMVENQWLREYLEQSEFKEKTHFAPPGVDTDIFNPDKDGNGGGGRPYILSVGRFKDPRKDVRTLFEAYALFMQRVTGTPNLILAGRSLPEQDDIDFAKELGIWDQVILKKDVALKDLVSLYRNAEIFVLSSREEGLGMVIMEAMACGTAVVSTDCGGPGTLIENDVNGFLTEVGNVSALSQKMVELYSDETKRNNFIRKSLEKIESSFSYERSISRYLTLYNSLIR